MKKNNYKKYLIFLILMLVNTYCSKSKKTGLCPNKINMETFHLVIKYNLPFEILVNDIVTVKDLKNGYQGAENISLYFTDNNIQNIKVRFYPDLENNMKIIPATSISKQTASIFTNKNGTETKVKDLIIPSIEKDVPYYEYEWKFEAQAIKGLDNLNNSQDLSKIRIEELQKSLVNKYEDLYKILNNGDGKAFMKEIEKAKQNLFLAENLSTDQQNEYNLNMQEYFDSHKGTMNPITNFNIKIMGNGRAVALEYKTGKMQGLGILSSEDIPNHTMNINYIILHKPIGSDKFEIFRYNCSYTALK